MLYKLATGFILFGMLALCLGHALSHARPPEGILVVQEKPADGFMRDSRGNALVNDNDFDNDGKPNATDPDDDNDGKLDRTDGDDDNDGMNDNTDGDDDNDGIIDINDPDRLWWN